MTEHSQSGSILGTRVKRVEDDSLLRGRGTFVENLELPGAAHLAFVRSVWAHAELRGVDATDALDAPGVVAVITADDVDLDPLPGAIGMAPPAMVRPLLATDRLRFVGEPVAVVVAETRAQAVDAAELVIVDAEPLEAVVDPEDAIDDEVLLYPEAGTNTALLVPADVEADEQFRDCEVVVRQRIVNQRLAPVPLEVRNAASRWEDGRLTHWSTTQNPHNVRDSLAGMFGLEASEVRVICPDVGGGFGPKSGLYPEERLTAEIARQLGRPMRWVETRSESMLGIGHGRAQVQHVTIGGRRDGTVTAYRLEVLQDSGGYPSVGAVLPFMTRMMTCGTYDIATVAFSARSVVTNTVPTESYRGAGRPEATAAVERMIDLFAAEIGRSAV
ncbi:MAG: xanthine dehydrogenase family protein molybdopterin-binding subunit, partial [Microthrixaceae bacterium]|nr:xanthine dehydrogenase family protein molybdopterin-binding subunit [Microthrixaceae bacterium]